jgi:hypothetical protein
VLVNVNCNVIIITTSLPLVDYSIANTTLFVNSFFLIFFIVIFLTKDYKTYVLHTSLLHCVKASSRCGIDALTLQRAKAMNFFAVPLHCVKAALTDCLRAVV